YVQLAHAAESRGDLQAARDNYRKALDVDPDNATAHNGLANILDRLGDTAGAGAERAAAQSGGGSVETPSALKTISPSEEAASGTDARQFVEERRAEARRLIQEGDELAQQGDKDGAREKWQQAISMAPGTPERDAAKARMDQTQTPPNFDVQ
ncbi:MAG TPA: tetratricopeptide repeat protein, partial [Chthonomonadaceae bacterium]|nr:tetratricopeptide repeat protein [Chthonomonadaceae bacterium]